MELRIRRYHYSVSQHGILHESKEDVLQSRISDLHEWEDVEVVDVFGVLPDEDEDTNL